MTIGGLALALKILVVRLGALGDIVHAVPAVAALRRRHPAARIDWIVDERHRAAVDAGTRNGNAICGGSLAPSAARTERFFLMTCAPDGTLAVSP